MTKIYTTLNKIRAHSPCEDGWKKLLKSLGKTSSDDKLLAFSRIIESNGLDDALWCLRTICPEHDREVRLFAADCAESVLHIYERDYPTDTRPRNAIKAARDFANGLIDEKAMAAAWSAAWDAARAAAAWDAAGADDAWDAARAAAEAAAAWSDAAWSAARDAALDAAGTAQIKMIAERFS